MATNNLTHQTIRPERQMLFEDGEKVSDPVIGYNPF